jgi:hypothetical protein
MQKNMEPFAVQGDNVVVAGRYQARVKSTGKRIEHRGRSGGL